MYPIFVQLCLSVLPFRALFGRACSPGMPVGRTSRHRHQPWGGCIPLRFLGGRRDMPCIHPPPLILGPQSKNASHPPPDLSNRWRHCLSGMPVDPRAYLQPLRNSTCFRIKISKKFGVFFGGGDTTLPTLQHPLVTCGRSGPFGAPPRHATACVACLEGATAAAGCQGEPEGEG